MTSDAGLTETEVITGDASSKAVTCTDALSPALSTTVNVATTGFCKVDASIVIGAETRCLIVRPSDKAHRHCTNLPSASRLADASSVTVLPTTFIVPAAVGFTFPTSLIILTEFFPWIVVTVS